MCYKVLKATKVCENGHVLERQECWRQCLRVPNLDHAARLTRCRTVVSPAENFKIDDMHGPARTSNRLCVLCTPSLDGQYQRIVRSDVESKKEILARRYREIIEEVRESVDKPLQTLGETYPRFYYGATTEAEEEARMTARPNQILQTIDEEGIIDWTTVKHGRRSMRVYGVPPEHERKHEH